MTSPSDRVTLPERGLTLLPPWPQAIVFADKRLENRGASVAGHIGAWRGMVALSQSKKWDAKDAADDAEHLAYRGLIDLRSEDEKEVIGDEEDWKLWAGKLVAVAELMDVLPPDRCDGDPWHIPGQHGLILGQVWEVEPVPIIGGRGCWYAGQCPQCDSLQARDRIDGYCRRCGVTPDREGTETGFTWKRPELKIIRECTL